MEPKVAYLFALGQPLAFVIGPDAGQFIVGMCKVEVIGGLEQAVPAVLNGLEGEIIKKTVVGLQVDRSPGYQDVCVFIKESLAGQSLPLFFILRIGECDPYLGNFSGGEDPFDVPDHDPDKRGVGYLLFLYGFATPPQAGPFPVDPHEIPFRVTAGKANSIFPLPASQFGDDRMGIFEVRTMPGRPHGECVHQFMIPGLKEVWKGEVFLEVNQLLLPHKQAILQGSMRRRTTWIWQKPAGPWLEPGRWRCRWQRGTDRFSIDRK